MDAPRNVESEAEQTTGFHYQITVRGVLDEHWSAWFDGLRITHDSAGDTMLAGAVRDQTALYGLLAKARDLGLTLVAVEQGNPATDTDPVAPQ